MKRSQYLKLAIWILPLALLLVAAPAFATPICPTATNGGSNYRTYAPSPGGCNIVITYALDGSISTQITNPHPYDRNEIDGGDDQVIGVVNNSLQTIFSITLTNPGQNPEVFAFDGDGICSYTLSGVQCPGGYNSGQTSSYLGLATSFSGIDTLKDTGTVNFSGGIAPSGGTAFFSLEGPVSLTGGLQILEGVPEPMTLALIGIGLCGIGLVRRRVRKA